MSIIWSEQDENGVKALEMLVENEGDRLPIPRNGKDCVIKFDVLDYFKANNFIMDLAMFCDEKARAEIEEITGIRVNEVGYSSDRGRIDRALEKLEEVKRELQS